MLASQVEYVAGVMAEREHIAMVATREAEAMLMERSKKMKDATIRMLRSILNGWLGRRITCQEAMLRLKDHLQSHFVELSEQKKAETHSGPKLRTVKGSRAEARAVIWKHRVMEDPHAIRKRILHPHEREMRGDKPPLYVHHADSQGGITPAVQSESQDVRPTMQGESQDVQGQRGGEQVVLGKLDRDKSCANGHHGHTPNVSSAKGATHSPTRDVQPHKDATHSPTRDVQPHRRGRKPPINILKSKAPIDARFIDIDEDMPGPTEDEKVFDRLVLHIRNDGNVANLRTCVEEPIPKEERHALCVESSKLFLGVAGELSKGNTARHIYNATKKMAALSSLWATIQTKHSLPNTGAVEMYKIKIEGYKEDLKDRLDILRADMGYTVSKYT